MESKHAIVIDKNGYKVEFVLVDFYDKEGIIKEEPYSYILKDDESLVYDGISEALSMLKPHWNGETWEETAAPEEIEVAQPEPQSPTPTPEERLAALESAMLAVITRGGAANV